MSRFDVGYGTSAWTEQLNAHLWINDSGIQIDCEKAESQPCRHREMEEYRETFKFGEETVAIRVFDVPWTSRKAWVDWVLGYSVNTLLDASRRPILNPSGFGGGYSRLREPGNVVPVRGFLSRAIPVQHPEMPWLYAQEIELLRGLSTIDERRDITCPKNAAERPFMDWDSDFNARPTLLNLPEESFLEDARGRLMEAQRLLALSSFPLDGEAALLEFLGLADWVNAAQRASGLRLLDPAATLDSVRQEATILLPEFNVHRLFLQQMNVLTELVAQRRDEVAQAEQALEDARREAATRRVVPMLRFRDRDPGTGLPTKDGWARYAVTYRSLPYTVRSDRQMLEYPRIVTGELERFVERKITYATKALPIPSVGNNALRFINDASVPASIRNTVVPQAGTMLVPFEEITHIWHDVPDVPFTAINNAVGRINANPFDGAIGHRVYLAQTLLCQAPDITPTPRGLRGRVSHRITYKFLHNPNGWNNFPAADGNFYRATFGGTVGGAAVYRTADFNALFVQPPPRDYQIVERG